MAYVKSGLPCPMCDSSDAYAIDENDWGNCFSCNGRRYEGDNSYSKQAVKPYKGKTMEHR